MNLFLKILQINQYCQKLLIGSALHLNSIDVIGTLQYAQALGQGMLTISQLFLSQKKTYF